MTKRKPRRKAKKPSRSGSSWIWGTIGLLSLGWVVYDTNRDTILSYAQLAWGEPERPAAVPTRVAALSEDERRPAAARPAAAARPTPVVARPAEPRKLVAIPPAPTSVTAKATAPEIVTPKRRPNAAAAPASGQAVTGRATPLYRGPSTTAPVWVRLEAGHTLRVTERKGAWRRVEAGIFTGWIEAEALATRAPAERAPVRAAAVRDRPVPPGAIPEARR